jgi:hypothetical protein
MQRTREEYRPRCVADLGTPLVWSLTVGLVAGGLVAIAARLPLTGLGVGVGVFGIAFVLASYRIIVDGPDRTQVWEQEEWLQRDLDGDGIVGAPEREYVPVRLDVEEGGRHRFLDLDVTREMGLFAARVITGSAAFAEAAALECGMGKADFEALRDTLLARGVIRWKNPDNHRSGYDFLGGFHATLRAIVDHAPGEAT